MEWVAKCDIIFTSEQPLKSDFTRMTFLPPIKWFAFDQSFTRIYLQDP